MTISAIVLAAGRSSRFGEANKLLADVSGRPMIKAVTGAVAESRVQDIVLVTGNDGGRVAAAVGPGPWRIVANPEPGLGLSSSIRAGLAALSDEVNGVLIVLGDMPGVSAALIDQLIAAFEAHASDVIVYPVSTQGRQGHPVLWPAALFAELSALTGDTGAKALLSKYSDRVVTIAATGDAAFFDVDTVEDLNRPKGGATG